MKIGSLVAAAAVGTFAALSALSSVSTSMAWTPDAIEHAGIAHAWCNGRGFVDPIHFNYWIDARVPVPAFAVRAPLVPLLLAVPICLGATLAEASAWHALWAGAVAAGAVMVAVRWMSLPAAVAAVSIITATFWWQLVAATPLTEVTAFAAVLFLIVTLPGVSRSPTAATACALATLVVWLARPNLAVAAVAVVVTVVWQQGLRGLLSRSLWAYVGALVAMVGVIHVSVSRLTGFAPYESGAVFGRILEVAEASRYGHVYQPPLTFIAENWDAIARIGLSRLSALWQSLFLDGTLLRIGWVAVPAIAYTLLRRDRPPEAIFCALLALLLSAIAVTNYSFFEPRYLLFPAMLGALVAAPLVDSAALALGEWLAMRASPVARHLPRLALYALVAALVFPSLPGRGALRSVAGIAGVGLRPPTERRDWCRFPGDAIVATDAPWRVHLWCGNAAVMIPQNVRAAGVLERFLDEQRVGYVLLTSSRAASFRFLQRARGLRLMNGPEGAGDLGSQPPNWAKKEAALFAVVGAEGVAGWSSPGPLERTGLD